MNIGCSFSLNPHNFVELFKHQTTAYSRKSKCGHIIAEPIQLTIDCYIKKFPAPINTGQVIWMNTSGATYCIFIWLCCGAEINEKEQGNSLNYKGERERKLAELPSSLMQKCYTIISGMKGNIHNYSLHRTGNKWKGWLWQERKRREIWETGRSAFQTQKMSSANSSLTRLATYAYDKAENKCTV